MSENQSSYRTIFKATSLFGGVQVFTIIISIIRSKFIAILLGPTGIGVVGLLNSTLFFIAALTNFGLERSAVKNVSEANGSGNNRKIALVIGVLKRLVWITGTLGAIMTFVFSNSLSRLTFGNEDYSFGFMFLSITLLLNQITAGEKVVLRGLRKLNFMAKSSLWGSILGLLTSIPLYYIWGLKGIVPAIIISAFAILIVTFFFSRRVSLEKVVIDKNDIIIQGKNMLLMGLVLSLSSIIVLGESYLVKLYIRMQGSIEDVGFYNAGFAIVNSYFGVVFSALTIDYYPRLAGVASDNNKASILMSQQSEMTVLIIAPLLAFFLVFVNFFVVILYSNEFLPINEMMLWAGLGIYFRAASWSLGIIFISKGDMKTLFWSELGATSIMLLSNILGYTYYGLEGLGISFLFAYIYAYIQNFLIVKFKYNFSYEKDFYMIFIVQLFLGIIGLLSAKVSTGVWTYILGSIIVIVASIFSLKKLDEKMNIINLIKEKFKTIKS